MKNKKILFIILIILTLIILDQLMKVYIVNQFCNSSVVIIKNILKFTYAENTGGAYGIR